MKTKTIISGLLVIATVTCIAQDNSLPVNLQQGKSDYHTAIGLRGGETSGFTFKQKYAQSRAIEGIIGVWRNGISATLLVETYEQAFDVPGLKWYYGAGAHASMETSYYYIDGRRYSRGGGLGLGVDGIVGIEYKIPPIPFAISLDVKPYAEVNTNGNIYFGPDPGLGIKVTF
jgi:hypothetical protein